MIVLYIAGIRNASRLYEFATSGLKWFILAAQIVIPIIMIVWFAIKKKNKGGNHAKEYAE
jgi:uncharacterized transporter YbjL